jgi:iron complex outermembrane receptor protein
MVTGLYRLKLLTGVVALFCWSGMAWAELEEIVVTAQKRAENVQDVPISITAVPGDFMEASGANTLQDLGRYVPNLSLTHSSNVANQRIILRGVGSVGDSALEPSVAVFIDGVYYPRPSSVVGSLTDLEMVEVLRGPQGTMFGRNASMGALNIRTARPTQELEGQVRASYGSYDALRTSGYVSGGITESAAGRLSFQYSDRDGYGDNTYTGNGNDDEVGAWEDLSLRGQVNIAVTDDIEVNLTADYATVENEGNAIEVVDGTVVLPTYLNTIRAILSPTGPFNPTGDAPEMTDGDDHVIHQDHRDQADDDQWGFAAHIDWSVADHTVRSITAFREWSNDTFESALRLPADLLNRDTTYDLDTFSQEFQILSPTDGRIEYVAGLYFHDEDYAIDQNFHIGANFCSPTVGNLIAARTAQNGTAATAALAAALAPVIGAIAPAVAAGIVNGTITTPAAAIAAGVPAGSVATVFTIAAGITPAIVMGTASVIGGQAAAFCNAGASTNAIDTQFNQELTSIALFGQLTFKITDDLRLTGGLRWTNDDKEGGFSSVIANPILAPRSLTNPFGIDLRTAENSPNLVFEDDELTWLVNLSYYVTDNIMLFGNYSTGYKTGGFNSEGFNSIGIASGVSRVFESESTDNYEFGVKSSLFDNNLVANFTYFNTEISNFQDRQFDGVNFLVRNAGVLTQQGLEIDIQAQPTDYLYAVMGVGLIDSEFDSFPNATNLPAVVAATQTTNSTRAAQGLPPLPVPPRDLTGTANHFSPTWQFSLMAEWSGAVPRMDNLGWYLRMEHQYVSDQNLGAETNNNPQTIQEGYNLFNARLGVRSQDDKWDLAIFVRNAFDEGYCQTMYNQPVGTTLGLVNPAPAGDNGGMQRCVMGAPQTWGIEASYSF